MVGAIDALANLKLAQDVKPVFLSYLCEIDSLNEHASHPPSSLIFGLDPETLSPILGKTFGRDVKAVRQVRNPQVLAPRRYCLVITHARWLGLAPYKSREDAQHGHITG
jgi:hypothetical protein